MGEYKKYQELIFDLGTARTDEELEIRGDFILVEYLDGDASIKLDNAGHDAIDLTKVKQIKTAPEFFEKIYITNTAQTGKTLKLLIGGAASFTAISSESIGLYFDDEFTECAKVIAGTEYKDFVVMDSVPVDAGAVVTHTGIDVSKFKDKLILVSTTDDFTIYIQVSDDNTNWYDLKTNSDGDISFNCNNEKIAFRINYFSKYMRIVAKNNGSSAATISCVVSCQI